MGLYKAPGEKVAHWDSVTFAKNVILLGLLGVAVVLVAKIFFFGGFF